MVKIIEKIIEFSNMVVAISVPLPLVIAIIFFVATLIATGIAFVLFWYEE